MTAYRLTTCFFPKYTFCHSIIIICNEKRNNTLTYNTCRSFRVGKEVWKKKKRRQVEMSESRPWRYRGSVEVVESRTLRCRRIRFGKRLG